MQRYLGVDIGAETIKLVELSRQHRDGELRCARREIREHHKDPASVLASLIGDWDWRQVDGAAVTGRLARIVALPRIPTKQAQAAGFRFRHGEQPATIVSIGAHGFSVLELRASGVEVYRENSRCSQGTGAFLRQLVERFAVGIEKAGELCAEVADSAPLSGRCPVILKTDMTHLANRGESRARILAGLYDAVAENVQVLINPRSCPSEVLLAGGVTRARRIRDSFRSFLGHHGMRMIDSDDALFLEALGCAMLAAAEPRPVPAAGALLRPEPAAELELLPALCHYLPQVRRRQRPGTAPAVADRPELILGFDIGSTGSKLVALAAASQKPVWQAYTATDGDPVTAAQTLMRRFLESPAGDLPVRGFGVTGSGREIVGSLLATCFGSGQVFVLNEIAAHAEGALAYDRRVDTIFEIGGQDAKYIRLTGGRVIDAAMNEACSAGTGSFIEEQGRRLAGIGSVEQLGRAALEAAGGVSLGQHCSVFMAEVIDEAVAAGIGRGAIIAGIYDSVIQNYLNRVKGSRPVGRVIFCQGMPFTSDALAAAVARQTGSEVIVPPDPGTVGALGIALLARRKIAPQDRATEAVAGVEPRRFLDAEVLGKDQIVCRSTNGCGEPGNRCRIDRLRNRVGGRVLRFTWGGNCSLYDRGIGARKLPDLAPDPFRERAALLVALCDELPQHAAGPAVAITPELQLALLFPFFASFLSGLGCRLLVFGRAGRKELRRGIEEANVPYCAPMQLLHGLAAEMAISDADHLFLPMIRSLPCVAGEPHAVLCPLIQASPELLRANLAASTGGERLQQRLLTPLVELGSESLSSPQLAAACRRLAADLGAGRGWRRAFSRARQVQERFDAECLAIGHRALSFCTDHSLPAIVVLGRAYTLHNELLSGNVPSILRSQGAMAVPADCYPVAADVPVFDDVYWAFGQRSLRAAHQIRRTNGVYSLWCSNYSCGPDSFTLHFYTYIMEGKPLAIIETDGHSGDAGTRTRVEAFLHCVREDRQQRSNGPVNRFQRIGERRGTMSDIRERGERLLIPHMGLTGRVLAACLRGLGLDAEALPMADREALRLGRRHTSGKECLPMCVTLGSLLQRLDGEQGNGGRFALFMPTTCGPCRFGVYHLLHRIVLERQGWGERVRIWSPVDHDYFDGLPPGAEALIFSGVVTAEMLQEAYLDVRPREALSTSGSSGAASRMVFERHLAGLLDHLEQQRFAAELSAASTVREIAVGNLFGCPALLAQAVDELAALRVARAVPTVLMGGEIFVRLDPFANGFMVDKLTERGIRTRLAPLTEWFEYSDWAAFRTGDQRTLRDRLRRRAKRRIVSLIHGTAAVRLGWPPWPGIEEVVSAAAPYVSPDLYGEAVLTVGSPAHEWRHGQIDGMVSVGPLECMPNKIAEAQLFHLAENEELPSLTVPLNGDPIDPETLDSFAYEIHTRFRRLQDRQPQQ